MTSSSEKFLKDVRELIAENEIQQALDQLQNYLSSGDPELRNEVTLFISRYTRLRTEERKGIITRQEFQADVNRLSNSLLEFLKEIQKKIQMENMSIKVSTESSKAPLIDVSNNTIKILHLSDLHIKPDIDPISLYQPLFADLEDQEEGLGTQKLDYLVITGDLTDRAQKKEFQKAEQFIVELKKRYNLTDDKCIIIPGNHDLNWDEEVYEWKKARTIEKENLEKGKYVKQGEGILIRKDDAYPHRFKNFSEYLYRSVIQKEYLLPFEDQCIPFLFTEHRMLILAMNSSWEIDEYFKDRSGIHKGALARGLLQADTIIKEAKETGKFPHDASILKIAAWHHPVTGNEKIKNDAFLERLRQADFKLCLHGHVHEDRADIVGYIHPTRQIRIVGAGSFDAPGSDRPESIPRLYNLIEISPDHSIIRVHTRCKRKGTGSWTGYAVWPGKDRHSKQAYYEIDLQ